MGSDVKKSASHIFLLVHQSTLLYHHHMRESEAAKMWAALGYEVEIDRIGNKIMEVRIRDTLSERSIRFLSFERDIWFEIWLIVTQDKGARTLR